ncbi:hypothetical protein BDP27DRAFT_1418034 [Rhodocollybia butyracea]|uniref:Uncharacterized protein n=1 Tax=Rhodocollybia butyracea TaxID=206335 RepID=A0A9P5UAU8_9AGAR|nr:hypothetical protein BDP27DRAFT_1418034 [Rhodocollybia butyracea]
MQPKVVCLYLLAMLMFGSTVCSLPTKLPPRPLQPMLEAGGKSLATYPALPASLTASHTSRTKAKGRIVPNPSPNAPMRTSPFKAFFLNSSGKLKLSSGAPHPADRAALGVAKRRVRSAIKAIFDVNKPAIKVDNELKELFDKGVAKAAWGKEHISVGDADADPVLYFAIKGRVCKPYCLGFTVRSHYRPLQDGGSQGVPAYSELLCPKSAGFGKFTSKEVGDYKGDPETESKVRDGLAEFSKFSTCLMENIAKAKVKDPAAFILETEATPEELADAFELAPLNLAEASKLYGEEPPSPQVP